MQVHAPRVIQTPYRERRNHTKNLDVVLGYSDIGAGVPNRQCRDSVIVPKFCWKQTHAIIFLMVLYHWTRIDSHPIGTTRVVVLAFITKPQLFFTVNHMHACMRIDCISYIHVHDLKPVGVQTYATKRRGQKGAIDIGGGSRVRWGRILKIYEDTYIYAPA